MIQYKVSYVYAHTHLLYFELKVPHTGPYLDLQLPAWRPGRYELQNFAKNIKTFEPTDEQGRTLPFTKISKDCWRIAAAGASEVTLRYTYFAAKMDAGNSWLDEGQVYINWVNCIFFIPGRERDLPYQVSLNIPDSYHLATSLPRDGSVLSASSFEVLADSPLIASPALKHVSYELNGSVFHIWLNGEARPDWRKLMADFQAFTQVQIELFGGFPEPDYHFLIQLLPYPFYHGVEHEKSTVIALGPGSELHKKELYNELLGVSSHELFHVWNIKKIRPYEMLPYDYTQENYFTTGYVAEGVTTYYGDLFLLRSGVFSLEEYFTELNRLFKRHFDNAGRFNLSVAASSYDLWLDGYTAGIPGRKVSIYVKGALAALILDLTLRHFSGGERSLDDVMRLLWQEFGQKQRGYTAQDYRGLAEKVAGCSLETYFQTCIEGNTPLEQPLAEALDIVGCELEAMPAETIQESRFGFRTEVGGKEYLRVTEVAPGSPAEKVLAPDDLILAVNQQQIAAGNLSSLLRTDEVILLQIFRNHQFRTVRLDPDGHAYFVQYKIRRKQTCTPQQEQQFEKWTEIRPVKV